MAAVRLAAKEQRNSILEEPAQARSLLNFSAGFHFKLHLAPPSFARSPCPPLWPPQDWPRKILRANPRKIFPKKIRRKLSNIQKTSPSPSGAPAAPHSKRPSLPQVNWPRPRAETQKKEADFTPPRQTALFAEAKFQNKSTPKIFNFFGVSFRAKPPPGCMSISTVSVFSTSRTS